MAFERGGADGSGSAAHGIRRGATRDVPRDAVWWMSCLSLTGFVLETRYGTAAMAICLGVWAMHVLAWPGRDLRWMESVRLPWLMPLFATLSALWSIEPEQSLKLGLEFLVFTGLSIVAVQAQSMRSFVSSFMCALLVGVLLSAALRTTAAVGTTGEVALVGIFGSKNNLASFVCLSMIASIAVLADPAQGHLLRGLAAMGLAIDPAMLIKAHSLGALLAGGGATVTTMGVAMLGRLERRQRNLLLTLGFVMLCGMAGFGLLALSQGFDLSTLLAAAGKDPSLTGRTFLWSRARDYIGLRPALGVGYQAFWVQGHVEAEALWRFAQIASRTGFHFHNLYYETAVELGGIGAVIMGVSLLAVTGAVVWRALVAPDPGAAFLCGLVMFYAMRVGVELDFLDPFSPGSLLLPVAWVGSRRRGSEVRVGG